MPPPGAGAPPHAPHTELLVLQPTPLCNLDCSYCYLPQRDRRARMSLRTLRLALQRLREDALLGAELTIVWHAGEPLVVPPAWYDEALALVHDELGAATQVRHALQTNGTLIDAAWCALFLRHRVQLGVSIDGPAALHDLQRRTRRGGPTHAAVMRGVRLLQQHGVPFHAIAVTGAAALADARALYHWFAEAGITELGCNIDEAEGAHAVSSLQGREDAHAAFVAALLRCAQDGRVQLREFSAARALLRAPLPRWGVHGWPANAQVMPLALISVAHDGSFTTFSPELLGQPAPAFGDFVLGRVQDGGYLAALRREPFARLWREIEAGVHACRSSCAYFEFCGGGAPANKFYEHGSFAATSTLYCRSALQRPLEAVLAQAEAELGWAA